MLNTSNNTFQNSHGSLTHTWDEETEDLKISGSVDNELSYEKQTLAVCRVRLPGCESKESWANCISFRCQGRLFSYRGRISHETRHITSQQS